MAVNIPKLSDLYNNIKGDLETAIGITPGFLGKKFLSALAAVQAAKMKLIYLLIGDVQKNIFVDTADPESVGGTLERFGRVKLGRSLLPATAGVYTVSVTGTVGATIQANTTFKSNDDALNPSKLFVLDTSYTLVSGTNTISLRAFEGGTGSRLDVGDKLTATAPISSVDEEVTVTVETTSPTEAETVEEYRDKVIEAFQLEPQGGAASDYRIWSADAAGVRTVYPFVRSGVYGEIDLYVEATEASSVDGKGTPSTAMLTNVESVVEFDPDTTKPLNERGRRPLGVFQLHVNPITIVDVDIIITGYVGVTASIKTNIENAIKTFLLDVRPFVAGADVLADKNDILTVNKLIFNVQEAEPGSVFTSLTMKINTVDLASYQFFNGEIPYLNSITYV